jgi:opacity protein-like surface antigen
MKSLFASVLVLVALSLGAIAQTAPAAPPDPLESGWNVSITGSFSNVSNAATNNGFVTTEALRVAQHWNARADEFITLTPATVIVLAGPEYRFSLEHLLKSSSFAANAATIEAFAHAGAGTARSQSTSADGSTTLSAARFAYGIGGGFDVKLNATMSVRPLDLTYVRSSMLTNGGAILGNHLQFAAGLGIRF